MPGDGVSVVLCKALIEELCLRFRLPGFALAYSVLRSGSSEVGVAAVLLLFAWEESVSV